MRVLVTIGLILASFQVSASFQENLIKRAINLGVTRNVEVAREILYQPCSEGIDYLAEEIYLLNEDGDITKVLDELGVVMAMIKQVDRSLFIYLRDEIAAGNTSALSSAFDKELLENNSSCSQVGTIYDLLDSVLISPV